MITPATTPDALTIDRLRTKTAAPVPQWHVENIDHFEHLPGGYSNRNYRFDYNMQTYVLRVPTHAAPYVDRQHEYSWYQRMPANVGVQPVSLDWTTGLMISPWVNGVLLAQSDPMPELSDLAAYVKTLHRALPSANRAYNVEVIAAQYLQTPISEKKPIAEPSVPALTCHNDLNPWNILITDDGWVTLDWEFVGENDPLFDVVALHQGLGLPQQELQDFTRLYVDHWSDQIEQRLHRALESFWIREMSWAHYQISIGNIRDEILLQKISAEEALAAIGQRQM